MTEYETACLGKTWFPSRRAARRRARQIRGEGGPRFHTYRCPFALALTSVTPQAKRPTSAKAPTGPSPSTSTPHNPQPGWRNGIRRRLKRDRPTGHASSNLVPGTHPHHHARRNPMTQTPADKLRAAADKLRALAEAVAYDIAANPYWGSDEYPPHDYPNLYARGVDNDMGGPAGSFAATMHPGVGLALADWLDAEADALDGVTMHDAAEYPDDDPDEGPQCVEDCSACTTERHALAVARQILGGDQ